MNLFKKVFWLRNFFTIFSLPVPVAGFKPSILGLGVQYYTTVLLGLSIIGLKTYKYNLLMFEKVLKVE
jgi:hypothetical protein